MRTGPCIVEVSPPNDLSSGDYFYRAEGPFSALSQLSGVDRVLCITSLHPRRGHLMENADILVLNSLCDPDLLPILEQRRQRGLPTVYDLHDDVTAFQRWNPIYYFYQQQENQLLVFKTISLCDALQANNQALLDRFGELCQRTFLFPNHLRAVPPALPPGDRPVFTVGWGGSHGHLEDLRAVAPALGAWISETPGTRLAIMGSRKVFEVFESVPEDRKAYTPPGSLADYYRFLPTLDAGLAPLCDTSFNRSRSDVKFIEYAAHGAVAVMQRLQPYLGTLHPGDNGLLFSSPAELVEALGRLHGSPELRHALRQAAFAYVGRHRLEAVHARDRLEHYSVLLRAPSALRLGAEFPTQVPAQVTEFEALMYKGLVLMETRDEAQEARRRFLEAQALEPECYLPNLFLAKVAPKREEEMNELLAAQRKNPRSVRARIMLGDALQRRGSLVEAMMEYEAAAKLYGRWEVPYLRFAACLERLGVPAQAQQFRDLAATVATWLPGWTGGAQAAEAAPSPVAERGGAAAVGQVPGGVDQ